MMRSAPVDIKQRTITDWERIIRRGSPTRCKELITKTVRQRLAWLGGGEGALSLTTSQHNLLEAALNTGDL